MGERQQFTASIASTRVDLHGDQLTKEFLEEVLAEYQSSGEFTMLDLNHQTNLPPLGFFQATKLQLADDGEYELVGEGQLFNDDDYKDLEEAKIQIPTKKNPTATEMLSFSFMEVGYDRNYTAREVTQQGK